MGGVAWCPGCLVYPNNLGADIEIYSKVSFKVNNSSGEELQARIVQRLGLQGIVPLAFYMSVI